MLFIMLNEAYPFDRHDGKELMYEKQMTRNYHLEETVDRKVTDLAKDIIHVMLEPDAKKRPDIFLVCKHPWFPIVLREAELLGLVAPSRLGSSSDSALVNRRPSTNTRQNK